MSLIRYKKPRFGNPIIDGYDGEIVLHFLKGSRTVPLDTGNKTCA